MKKRVKFIIEYEVDLDSVPGWGHQVEDWVELATCGVLRQTHYNTTAKKIENIDQI